MSEVRRTERVIHGVRCVVTVTTTHNPEAVERAQEFMARECARAIIARRKKNGGESLAGAVSEPKVPALVR